MSFSIKNLTVLQILITSTFFFKIVDPTRIAEMLDLFVDNYSIFELNEFKEEGNILEWKIVDTDIRYYYDDDPTSKQYAQGVKVSIDKEKKLIVTIRKNELAKDSADARPEVFSPGNALDAKITELDLVQRKIKLSVKAAQIDEEKSLISKFGEGATKSGATLRGIFEKAIGKSISRCRKMEKRS